MAIRLIIDENSVYEIDEDYQVNRNMNHSFISKEMCDSENASFFVNRKGSRNVFAGGAEKGDG